MNINGNQEQGKRRPQQRFSAEKRRAQLLQIAVGLFSERGFEGTTTKSIAAAARVSEGIIFQHFATKEDLYSCILDYKAKESGIEAWEEQLRGYAEREDDEALVRSMVERILQMDRMDPQFQRLMFQAALNGHVLPKIMAQRILPLHQFLCDYIKRRQKKGVFLKCDPGVAVHAIVSMPSYYGLARSLFGLEALKVSERKMAESFTRLILEGLRVSKKPTRKQKASLHPESRAGYPANR